MIFGMTIIEFGGIVSCITSAVALIIKILKNDGTIKSINATHNETIKMLNQSHSDTVAQVTQQLTNGVNITSTKFTPLKGQSAQLEQTVENKQPVITNITH